MLWASIHSVISMKLSGADSIVSHLVYSGSEINDSKKMTDIFNEISPPKSMRRSHIQGN